MTNTYADMATIHVWSSHISYADIRHAVEGDRQLRRLLDADIKRAQRSTSEHVYGKVTMEVAGETRITDQPPLLFHPQFDLLTASREFFDAYAQTLREDHRSLLQRYRLVMQRLRWWGLAVLEHAASWCCLLASRTNRFSSKSRRRAVRCLSTTPGSHCLPGETMAKEWPPGST
jgi:hypothetical protein